MKFCSECGNEVNERAEICVKCGCRLRQARTYDESKSKVVAALLCLFLGGLGAHRFYLNDNAIALLQLACLPISVIMMLVLSAASLSGIAAGLFLGAVLIHGIWIFTDLIRILFTSSGEELANLFKEQQA